MIASGLAWLGVMRAINRWVQLLQLIWALSASDCGGSCVVPEHSASVLWHLAWAHRDRLCGYWRAHVRHNHVRWGNRILSRVDGDLVVGGC